MAEKKETLKKEKKLAKKTPAKENIMRAIRIEKVTLSIGAGADPENVKKAMLLLETISGKKAVEAKAKRRIAGWKIRPGLAIGAKVTVRGKDATDLLKTLLISVDNKLKPSQFTSRGVSFGIPEYIDIPGVKYNPKIGIIGLQASVTLYRRGFRISKRKLLARNIRSRHAITKEETIAFMQKNFGVKTGGDE